MSHNAAPLASNRYELLVGADAFMQSLSAALQDCEQSLYAQFSTFEGDASGQAFADLLRECVQVGADVRLMVDRYSDVVQDDIYPTVLHRRAELKRELAKTAQLFEDLVTQGVKMQRTAPPGFLGMYMLYRNHKKMVLIDNQVAFVGGINISDHNFAWHDFMVRIEGPLVQALSRDFLSTWEGETITFDRPSTEGDYILNQCAGRYSLFAQILRMIDEANYSIVIESPYLMGDHIESAILRAAQRGVKVQLILPYHNNKLLYRIWARQMYRRFEHPNINLYGYRGEHDMTHAKLIVVDDEMASFGSFNMFELEGLTQKDLNVFTRNADFIAVLQAFIEQDITQSEPIAQPRHGWGRFSYGLLYGCFNWWTQVLVQRPEWRAKYC